MRKSFYLILALAFMTVGRCQAQSGAAAGRWLLAVGFNFTPVSESASDPNARLQATASVPWMSPVAGALSIVGTIVVKEDVESGAVAWNIQRAGTDIAGAIENGGEVVASGTAQLTDHSGFSVPQLTVANGECLVFTVRPTTGLGGGEGTLYITISAATDPIEPEQTTTLFVVTTTEWTTTTMALPPATTSEATTTTTLRTLTPAALPQQRIVSIPWPSSGPLVWNLADDFRLSPEQANPSPASHGFQGVKGIWHYMRGTGLQRNSNTYLPLALFVPDAFDFAGIQEWQGVNPSPHIAKKDNLPAVGVNASGEFQQVYSMSWEPGVVRMHPDQGKLVVVGWRCPIAASVSIEGSFKDMDAVGPGGVAWYIDHGETTLASGKVANGSKAPFSLSNVLARPGDFIYFVVDPDGDFGCDSTALDLTITANPPKRHP